MRGSWTTPYERDGFAVVPQILTRADIERLIGVMAAAVGESGQQHAMRDLLRRVPEVRSVECADSVCSLAELALGSPPSLIRGLYFDKTADSNWLVPWHQDLTVAVSRRMDMPGFGPWSTKSGIPHVQPPEPWLSRRVAVRLHLDDCGADNGPLRVLPETHKRGRLSAAEIDRQKRDGREETLCASAGDVIVMHPMLLHASPSASAPAHRRVIHLEYAADSLPAGLAWHEAGIS